MKTIDRTEIKIWGSVVVSTIKIVGGYETALRINGRTSDGIRVSRIAEARSMHDRACSIIRGHYGTDERSKLHAELRLMAADCFAL